MEQKELQQLIMQAQAYQQQMQMVGSQKETLNMQLIEIGKALEEVSKPGKDEVFKVIGPVLVKAERKKVKKDLESKKDLLMLRKKTLEKNESSLKEKLDELREKLSAAGG
jgi:prefoldin beta subunit